MFNFLYSVMYNAAFYSVRKYVDDSVVKDLKKSVHNPVWDSTWVLDHMLENSVWDFINSTSLPRDTHKPWIILREK